MVNDVTAGRGDLGRPPTFWRRDA